MVSDKAQTPPLKRGRDSYPGKGAFLSGLQLVISNVSSIVGCKYSNFFGKFVTCKE